MLGILQPAGESLLNRIQLHQTGMDTDSNLIRKRDSYKSTKLPSLLGLIHHLQFSTLLPAAAWVFRQPAWKMT